MAQQDEYVPSAWEWVRDQVDTYERSGGSEANTLRDTGLPIIIVTTRGAKSGAIRKMALMPARSDLAATSDHSVAVRLVARRWMS